MYYFRPEELPKGFKLERRCSVTDERGRVSEEYGKEAPVYIRAVLCGATPDVAGRYSQTQYPVSHVISHRGAPIAKEGDRLILRERAYYIRGVDDPGDTGLYTLYYCEERSGAHDGRTISQT